MMADEPNAHSSSPMGEQPYQIRSLKELITLVSGKGLSYEAPGGESGLAEPMPFPFLALVGQTEMKLALTLALINPNIGGVLLIGPRGTGKTTAVRSLLDLLPEVTHSVCFYGCLPEDIETGGMDAVCPDCARRYAEGRPLAVLERARLVELPLNATVEDVVGGFDERALVHERMRLKRGVLAQADRNLLYVDEVNLLEDQIIDAILDASAQSSYTVRRGPISATYHARFTLVGSMNPEEGDLRPQIMDRFGLRVLVNGLTDPTERLDAYRRVRAFRANPRGMNQHYADLTAQAQQEIQAARTRLAQVEVPEEIAQAGIRLAQALKISSMRADITLLEAARAYAAADDRVVVSLDDIRAVAPLALRLRRSTFMEDFLRRQQSEEDEIQSHFLNLHP